MKMSKMKMSRMKMSRRVRENNISEWRKKMNKKWCLVTVLMAFSVILLAACTGSKDKPSIYYLNFKPEAAAVWQEIAEVYEKETGVHVKVITAASGTYEQVLQSEIAKREAPTLFQINGPNALKTWGQFCLDLKDTKLYEWLLDKSLAVTDGKGVYGIPYVVEGYGIIYNKTIMNKYFSLTNRATDVNSVDEINNFEKLKAVVEDMTAHKDELGIEGVFASTSFAKGEDWRWQTHLLNLPVYYEFKDKNITDTNNLEMKYADNYKNIFDLYVDNSCTSKTELSLKTVNNSMEEFALGKVAMVQNGNWGWSQISGVSGNVVNADDVAFLPIYTGVAGEEKQSICIGTENYFCVSSWASKEDQKATIDFIEWLFRSEKGKDYVTNKLGFISPFSTFGDDEIPSDPLAAQVVKYMSDDKLTSVSWNFTAFPNLIFKDEVGQSLLDYLKGDKLWELVITDLKAGWTREKTGE